MAVLGGLLDRALRYVDPVPEDDTTVVEAERYWRSHQRFDPNHLAVDFGQLPAATTLSGWAVRGDAPLVIPPQTHIVALPRPRPREAIRVFLRQDLEAARRVGGGRDPMRLLVYPADLRWLSDEERREAEHYARHRGVGLLACPEWYAGLEAEVFRRLRAGRTIRQ
jgi:hypothetical protein